MLQERTTNRDDQLLRVLHLEAGRRAGPTAAGHGAQRLRLGFSLDSVVREYGALRDAIVATARVLELPVASSI